jgi:hypothetical protein
MLSSAAVKLLCVVHIVGLREVVSCPAKLEERGRGP